MRKLIVIGIIALLVMIFLIFVASNLPQPTAKVIG